MKPGPQKGCGGWGADITHLLDRQEVSARAEPRVLLLSSCRVVAGVEVLGRSWGATGDLLLVLVR